MFSILINISGKEGLMAEIKMFDPNKSINLIIKTKGSACNIACSYCFEQIKDVSCKSFTPSVFEKLLSQLSCKCSVVFHGGEPLLIGIEKFDQILNVAKKFYPNKIISVKIQTNGTLINQKWMELLFKKYSELNIEIAISLDGTKSMNKHRIDFAGYETYDRVIQAFCLLEKYGKKAGMLSVISRSSLDHVDEYLDLIQKIPNLQFVKINALFNMKDNLLSPDSITPIEYANFICSLAKGYIENKLYKKIAIEPILSIIQKINSKTSRYCNYSERKCFNYLSIYPDGSIGPCDCFSINDFNISNIRYFTDDVQQNVGLYVKSNKLKEINELVMECKKCKIYDFCTGGCLSQRFYFRNNKALLDNFCESKHFLFKYFKIFSLL